MSVLLVWKTSTIIILAQWQHQEVMMVSINTENRIMDALFHQQDLLADHVFPEDKKEKGTNFTGLS
jgi:hypothetical protein